MVGAFMMLTYVQHRQIVLSDLEQPCDCWLAFVFLKSSKCFPTRFASSGWYMLIVSGEDLEIGKLFPFLQCSHSTRCYYIHCFLQHALTVHKLSLHPHTANWNYTHSPCIHKPELHLRERERPKHRNTVNLVKEEPLAYSFPRHYHCCHIFFPLLPPYTPLPDVEACIHK